ncbi:MAG TPA: amidohydrolase family protein [Myxococcota bacterium]|nr:amidohydrolase family protein [Myxococcota bacterium]
MAHDLVIRGGTVVDGTGAPARTADVAVSDGRITDVGRVAGAAQRELDADGLLVTPGFVDIHTHYDGQATWDPGLSPSSWHGVTTVVMGNCGVGFAPVRPGQQDFLIGLMEGVEDIPGTALHEGIAWEWESFPEYLDALERRRFAVDVGTQVPHGAVRAYVMGERGARNQPATPGDVEAMAALVREGLAAGALGVSTSRTIVHRAITGEPVPGTFAAEDELFGLGRALGELGRGVFEVAGAGAAGEDIAGPLREIEWMRRLSAAVGRPVTFAMLQFDAAPELWRELLEISAAAVRDGAQIFPQVAGRPFGLLLGHQTKIHPFSGRPTFESLRHESLDVRVARMRDPETKRRILAERTAVPSMLAALYGKTFPMGDPPEYEPPYEASLEALAASAGRDVEDVLYDRLLEKDGRELLLVPVLNYSQLSCEPLREMLLHPRAVLGLGDGGAHCGIICDASIPTFMLTHWARDRSRGAKLPLELVVRRMTRDTSELFGLRDRGTLEPGRRADFNVIDFAGLRLEPPRMVHDLPAGGARFVQRARGYEATIVRGEVVALHDEPTGALPGRLIRAA